MTTADPDQKRWNIRNGRYVLDATATRILDELATGPILGQARPEVKARWVSALHMLVERVLDVRQPSFVFGYDHHYEYRKIADALLYLESEDMVLVHRNCGTTAGLNGSAGVGSS